MTPDQFRAIALSLPDSVECSHMNHPDFRVGGKIFATLGYPTETWGCVTLTAEEQAQFCRAAPDVFSPVPGAWGRAGATKVCLKPARAKAVHAALRAAWQNRVVKNTAPKPKRAKRKTQPGRSKP